VGGGAKNQGRPGISLKCTITKAGGDSRARKARSAAFFSFFFTPHAAAGAPEIIPEVVTLVAICEIKLENGESQREENLSLKCPPKKTAPPRGSRLMCRPLRDMITKTNPAEKHHETWRIYEKVQGEKCGPSSWICEQWRRLARKKPVASRPLHQGGRCGIIKAPTANRGPGKIRFRSIVYDGP